MSLPATTTGQTVMVIVVVPVCGESGEDTSSSCGKALETVSGIDVKEIGAMEVGAVFWHDRDYAITGFPEYMKGGHYIEQAHKAIDQGSVISITTASRSKIYVAVEASGRDGGFRNSLVQAGWQAEEGSVENTCCALNAVFSHTTGSGGTLDLPPTTTTQTVMVIVVVPVCN